METARIEADLRDRELHPEMAAAATRKAADDGSPGTDAENPSCWNRETVIADPSSTTGPPSARIARSVWSRVGAGSTTVVVTVGVESREQDRGLHLGRRHRSV